MNPEDCASVTQALVDEYRAEMIADGTLHEDKTPTEAWERFTKWHRFEEWKTQTLAERSRRLRRVSNA